MSNVSKEIADKLAGIAVQQIETAARFKEPRLQDIGKNEDLYLGKRRPSVRGRFNVALPIMEGFVETLMAKIDDPPAVSRKALKEEDSIAVKKIDAQWEFDKSPTRGRWDQKDRWAKKLAILSGRAIFKIFAESDPKYKAHLEVVDYYDFLCEPQGGANLEDHRFLGQMNLFRSKKDLEAGFESGIYDGEQVKALILRTDNQGFKRNEELFKNKFNRMKALGFTPENFDYIGEKLYNLTEWGMIYEGKRYYLLLDYPTGTWVRCEELRDVFESDLWQFSSWATEEDPFNFWNRAPSDIMRPVALAQQMVFNQLLDANARRVYGQRIYNTKVIDDPSQLEFRPEGLIGATLMPGQSLRDAVLTMETPEISSSINLIEFLKGFVGRETGVTPSAQGFGEEERVGILESNLQQVNDRLALIRKSYFQCWADLALRYDWGLWEHLPEGTMVKIIGQDGAEWEEIKRKDLEPEFDIIITGGNQQIIEDEAKNKAQQNTLNMIMANPLLVRELNPKWVVEEGLRKVGYSDEQIRVGMDIENYGNQALLAKAARVISEILANKEPQVEYEANTAFLQKILDAARKLRTRKPQAFDKMMNYINQHFQIVEENMSRELYKNQPLGLAGGAPVSPPTEAPSVASAVL